MARAFAGVWSCILPLAVLAFFQVLAADSEGDCKLHTHRTRRSQLEYIVPLKRIEKTPRWQLPNGKLPLAADKAAKIADKWFRSHGYAGAEIHRIAIKVPPVTTAKEFKGIFYYVIEASVGPLETIACVILADGSVVEPSDSPLIVSPDP